MLNFALLTGTRPNPLTPSGQAPGGTGGAVRAPQNFFAREQFHDLEQIRERGCGGAMWWRGHR
jgi:hypothetical protein